MAKCGTAVFATDDDIAHVHYTLDTKGHKHTPIMQYLLLFHCNSG